MAEWQTVRLGEMVKTNQSTYSPKENWQFVNYLDTGNIRILTRLKISCQAEQEERLKQIALSTRL
mgnify:CR=1 FL=1